MSIASLENRITASVSVFSKHSPEHKKFAQPAHLIKTLHMIEKRFDALDHQVPHSERILLAVAKVQKSGFQGLTRRDWKNIAWSLSLKLPSSNQKILFSPLGQKIIEQLNSLSNDLMQVIYFPLLYSYFAFEANEVSKKPQQWLELRQYLQNNRPILLKNMLRPKQWMLTLADHSELLTNRPTQRLNQVFLEFGDFDKLATLSLESLNISANSWLWDTLMRSVIDALNQYKESEYLAKLPLFFQLIEKHPTYKVAILSAVLNRHVKSSVKEQVHEKLKQLSLDQWGNPQYDASAGWHNVRAETKQMVIQWFVRADLEAFFKVFSNGAEVRRFNYWMRFIKQVSLSEIFLCDDAMHRSTGQQTQFINQNKSRLKRMREKSTTTNAFLIKIAGYYIIEFSELNNAAYFYREMPYVNSIKSMQAVSIQDLKSRIKSAFYLSHNSTWENRFDEKLKSLGIYPD